MDIDTLVGLSVAVCVIAVVVTVLSALVKIWSAGVVNRYSKFCPHCRQQIPIAATKCPHCTSDVPLDLASCESVIQAYKQTRAIQVSAPVAILVFACFFAFMGLCSAVAALTGGQVVQALIIFLPCVFLVLLATMNLVWHLRRRRRAGNDERR